MSIKRRTYYTGIFFLLPALLVFSIFNFYPFLSSIFYSFSDWNAISKAKFIGMRNYRGFFEDPRMIHGLKNTFIMGIFGIIIQNTLALGLAVLLNMKLRSRTYLRTAFYFPVIISLVVTSVVWSQLLKYGGVLNTILTHIGLESWVHDWLGTVQTALPTIILLTQWQAIGYCAVIYLAGLQSIPKEVYEAASIEGAKGIAMFRHITLPMLMSTVTIVMFLTVVGALKLFDLPYILTNGGPGQASYTVYLATYNAAFKNNDYGYASAAGVILSLIIITLTLIQLSITRRREVEM
ncbi:sugar ABC transporter permease [Paenibacillus psychroresistens]|uniref:Sugar ABC transporter permease n=1 Tax=Paenibacillus psychroresistens TaxID=1778678 RepID=A0A6B8RUK4_9BACL|nr:sugar ABC transporter permease [Paenibacillus psychroresistens]QGQ99502.1 sugar ABC transporter permease [Paenibacillus psychroresistens]